MNKVKQLFKILFLLMAIISLSACTKEDSGDGGGGGDSEYLWGETGSEATSLKKDVPMSDLETFIEYVAKVENLKLQTIKLFSNNWEGELFCGDMTNADPDKMNALITEILENRVRYEKAASQLEQAGVLSQVTTRGPVTATLDFINGLSEVTSDDENLIKDALEKTKMMGDKQAQQQLFDVLPNNLRAGCTDASTWFKKFNNRELTTKAHEIKKCWYFQASGVNDATMQFRDNLDAVTGTKNGNAVWNTAAKTTMTLADKGMNVQLATLDQLSGGSISKMQDVEIVMEETAKIRKKYKEGTLTSNDFAKLQTVVGKNLLDKVLEKYLLPEEYKTISDEMLKQVQSEMTDYVYEKELVAAEEDAAKGTNKSIMQTINNIAGAQMYGSLSVGSDGKVNVGLPNKDGNVTMVTSANTDQTVTSVTDKGDRATQKVKPKPGKETISADPAPSDLSYEIDPKALTFSANSGKETIDIYSDIKYYGVKSNEDWITVTKTARTVIVEVVQNETGQERKGSITIAFSQDKQTTLATVTVPVTQKADVEGDFIPQTTIDFNTLSFNLRLPYSIEENDDYWGWDKILSRDGSITIKKLDNNVYLVEKEYKNDYMYYENLHDETIENIRNAPMERPYRENLPYGTYWKVSFQMTITPSDVIPVQDCVSITDFKANGYIRHKSYNSHDDWDDENKKHVTVLHGFDEYESINLVNHDVISRRPLDDPESDRIDDLWMEYMLGFIYNNINATNLSTSVETVYHSTRYEKVDETVDEDGNHIPVYDWVDTDRTTSSNTPEVITLQIKWDVPMENRELGSDDKY